MKKQTKREFLGDAAFFRELAKDIAKLGANNGGQSQHPEGAKPCTSVHNAAETTTPSC